MMRPETVAIVILAAGGSQRMGRSKQVLPFRGRTLLRHAVETAIASACRPIVATIGAHEDLVRPELHSLPVLIAHNPDWTQGISSSLRAAIERLAQVREVDVQGAVFMLADQPLVTAEDINTLVKLHDRTGKDIVASAYANTYGVPMFISKRLFDEVATLSGNEGARQLIAHHRGQVATAPLSNAALDIDTPGDYDRFLTASALSDA